MKNFKTIGKMLMLIMSFMLIFPAAALADDLSWDGVEDNPEFTMYKKNVTVHIGEKSEVVLDFNNVSRYNALYAYCIIQADEENDLIFGDRGEGYKSVSVGYMQKNGFTDATFNITTSPDLPAGEYAMTATLVYKNRQGSVFTKDYPFILVAQSYKTDTELKLMTSSLDTGSATHGEKSVLTMYIENRGETTAKDVRIEFTNLSADTFFQADTYDLLEFDEIRGNSGIEAKATLIASDNIETGYYPIDIKVTYPNPVSDEPYEYTTQAFIHAIGEADEDEEEEESDDKSVPRVILDSYVINPTTVNMGEEFNFTFTLKNTSQEKTIKNLIVNLGSVDGAILPASGSNSFYIEEIPAGETKTLSLKLTSKNNPDTTSFPLNITMEYEDAKANPYTADEELTIPVYLPFKLTLQNQSYPTYGMVWNGVPITVDYINQGKGTIYNLTATVEGTLLEAAPPMEPMPEYDPETGEEIIPEASDMTDDINGDGISDDLTSAINPDMPVFTVETPSTYLGNIESGSSDYFETTITPQVAGLIEGRVIFSFEDAAGNPQEIIETFQMQVDEMPPVEPYDPSLDTFEPMPEENAGIPTAAKAALAAAALIAAIVGLKIASKKRKAKKLADDEALFADQRDAE